MAGDIVVRAIASTFSGESVGEFRSWLHTILKRAIADFYRARERTVAEAPLERDDDDTPPPQYGVADQTGYIEVQMIVSALLDELRDDHRRVVEIVVFEDRPADDACAEIDGMTPDNAYQVVRRFRQELRRRLEEGDNG